MRVVPTTSQLKHSRIQLCDMYTVPEIVGDHNKLHTKYLRGLVLTLKA